MNRQPLPDRRSVKSPYVRSILLGLLGLAAFAGPAAATPGDLDRSFAGNGKLAIDLAPHESVKAVAPVKKSKLVLAGTAGTGSQARPLLARLHRNGRLDSTFGDNGRLLLGPPTDGEIEVASMSASWNGAILVLFNVDHEGPEPDEFAVARVRRDGLLDTGFGDGGYAFMTFAPGQSSLAADLAWPGRDAIYVAGSTGGGFAVLKLTNAGQIDPGWSPALATFPGAVARATSLAVSSHGIVVAGFSGEEASGVPDGWDEDVAVARFLPTGELDPSFAGDGTQTLGFSGSDERANAVNVVHNGSVVTGGQTGNSGSLTGLMTRLRPNGEPREAFGRQGLRLLNLVKANGRNGRTNRITDLVHTHGRVVAGGYFHWRNDRGGFARFALARLRGDGKIQRSFGDKGRVHTKIGRRAFASAMTRSGPGARVVLAGTTTSRGTSYAALARYRILR